MSYEDGFAALAAAAAAATKGVVSAAAAMIIRWQRRNFDIRSAMIEFLIVILAAAIKF